MSRKEVVSEGSWSREKSKRPGEPLTVSVSVHSINFPLSGKATKLGKLGKGAKETTAMCIWQPLEGSQSSDFEERSMYCV